MSRSYITVLGILIAIALFGLTVLIRPAHAQDVVRCPVNAGQPIDFEIRLDIYKGKGIETDGYAFWGLSPFEFKEQTDRDLYVPQNQGKFAEILACHEQFPNWKVAVITYSSIHNYTDRTQVKGDYNDSDIADDREMAIRRVLEEDLGIDPKMIESEGSSQRQAYPMATIYFIRPARDGDDGDSALPNIWVGEYPSHPTPEQVVNNPDTEGYLLGVGDKYTNTRDGNEYVFFQTLPDGSIDWRISSRSGRDAYQPQYLDEHRTPPTSAQPGDTYRDAATKNTMINRASFGEPPQWGLYVPSGRDGRSGASGKDAIQAFTFTGGVDILIGDGEYGDLSIDCPHRWAPIAEVGMESLRLNAPGFLSGHFTLYGFLRAGGALEYLWYKPEYILGPTLGGGGEFRWYFIDTLWLGVGGQYTPYEIRKVEQWMVDSGLHAKRDLGDWLAEEDNGGPRASVGAVILPRKHINIIVFGAAQGLMGSHDFVVTGQVGLRYTR